MICTGNSQVFFSIPRPLAGNPQVASNMTKKDYFMHSPWSKVERFQAPSSSTPNLLKVQLIQMLDGKPASIVFVCVRERCVYDSIGKLIIFYRFDLHHCSYSCTCIAACLVSYAFTVNTVGILFIIWLSPIFTPSR